MFFDFRNLGRYGFRHAFREGWGKDVLGGKNEQSEARSDTAHFG
jgi:hypothetical protein